MNSRRSQFLQREPWGSPKGPPAKKPLSTRRPSKRDPRQPQWRRDPRTKPRPGPLFPGSPRQPKPSFGRRPATAPLPGTLLGKLKPLRPFLKLHPLIGAALTAWELYDLYQLWKLRNGEPATPFTNYRYCGGPRPPRKLKYQWARFSGCFNFQPVSGDYDVVPPRPTGVNGSWLQQWEQGGTTPSNTRFDTVQQWYFRDTVPIGGIPKLFPDPDIYIPVLPPEELPYPYPFATPPLPYTPRPTRPNQEPQGDPAPSPSPQPNVRPSPSVRPSPGLINPIPSIDYVPGRLPKPDFHERRPPDPEKEREKKKRLKPGTAAAWLSFLGKGIGSYTEADDAISAIYKGLPWKLRRWKGKDGVWRDRDHTSVRRAQRLFQLMGQLDIETAITELVKQELTDQAFGRVGRKLKERAKELGDEGLWSSSGGFQRGGSLQKKNWEDVYEKLKKDAAAKEKTRTYTVREQRSDGSWVWVKKTRPVTQIPWYRQKSQYRKRSGRFGTYYADRPSSRPMLRLD